MSRVGLFAIGEVSQDIFERLVPCLEERFLFKFIVEVSLPLPPSAYNASKKQYFAQTLLKKIKISPTSKLQFAVGITQADLYGTDINFMFGVTNSCERISIVSLHRLRPEFYGHPSNSQLLFDRLLKEVTQHLVRCIGGKNCFIRSCVMHATKNVYEIDSKSSLFCYDCERKIKLLTSPEQRSTEPPTKK